MIVIPIENQFSYTTIPRNQQLGLTVENHCNSPERVLVVDWKGDCFVCACEAWLPVSVGKITDFERLSDVWNSPTAQLLQQDIKEKKYSHCAVNRCGILNDNIVQNPYLISINVDESCNLTCPSCRNNNIMITQGDLFEKKLAQVNHIVKLLESFDQPAQIIMSGNGDPLASTIMRPLIHRFQPRENQTIRLFTNGLLLKKQLADSPITNYITQYFISIDAGSKSVYEQVRLGGQWEQLIDNLTFLQSIAARNNAEVSLTFVLQAANYLDVRNFAEVCIRFGFAGKVHRLEDWSTWTDFNKEDVIGNIAHPNHATAIAELKSVYNQYCERIYFGSSLVQLATETV